MARKTRSAKSEETKERSTPSRRQKPVLIKKRENSAEPFASPTATPRSVESLEAGTLPLPDGLHDRIAIRAHALYQHRGGHHGQDLSDWFEAERQVLSEVS